MFDPTTVRPRAIVVSKRKGMYSFKGAYSGRTRFFPDRPVEGIWQSADDLTEAPQTAEDDSEELIEWPAQEPPDEIKKLTEDE